MLRRLPILLLIVLTALALVSTGCDKQQPTEIPEPDTRPQEAEPVPEPEAPVTEVTEPFPREEVETEEPTPAAPTIEMLNQQLQTVYFAFDSSALDDAARAVLKANADLLSAGGPYNLLIEGHCDERGTIEYNLSLGERRASAMREYMTSLGANVSNIRIVSYGEEKPVDPGHNESAWSRNRRGVFLLEN